MEMIIWSWKSAKDSQR